MLASQQRRGYNMVRDYLIAPAREESPMPDDLHTTHLRILVDRVQGGDNAALEELLRRAGGRLERLGRSMLRRYPQVRAREQTADVVQEATLGLINALRKLTFNSTREFYGLAGEYIRRRLLDLARRHGRPGRNHVPLLPSDGTDLEPRHQADDDLERWQHLHEAVAELPAEQREVFSLKFYHDWGHQEIADLLQVSVKTINRLWFRAQMKLTEALRGQALPGADDEQG